MFEATTLDSGTFGIGTGTTTGTVTLGHHSGTVGMGVLNPSQILTISNLKLAHSLIVTLLLTET